MFPTISAKDILYRLEGYYGWQGWWPADSLYEMICGSILVQNTSWNNVEIAVYNMFRELGINSPEYVAKMDREILSEIIRPAGFMKAKSIAIQEVSKWIITNDALSNDSRLHGMATGDLRKMLLEIKGIGPETADVICLFVYDREIFIWSTYARRMLKELGCSGIMEKSYEYCRKNYSSLIDMEGLSSGAAQELHALIVRSGKEGHKKVRW